LSHDKVGQNFASKRNTMRRYPTWNDFIGKYPNDPQGAFEALCRHLFRMRYGIGDVLPYFYNNAGNETVPISVGKEIVGFQSKFFSGETIDDSQARQIKHSIEAAHTHYTSQTIIIVYTNLTFGNPPDKKQITARQKDIEDVANANHLKIEWFFGDNILDLVSKTPLAYSLFFDNSSNLHHLAASVAKMNELNFANINCKITAGGADIEIDRLNKVADLNNLLTQHKNILIYGESGSGKSAIVKQHWKSCDLKTQAYFFTRGIQYDTRSVNDLFLLDEEYTYVGFRDFYDGFDRKVLLIDSAERLTELSNRTVLQLMLEGLGEKGWQFIFTCKANGYDDLKALLRDLSVSVEDVKIDSLTEEELMNISKQHHIQLPTNEKVLRQLRIPFYLARYCELGGVNVSTLEAFREEIWKRKVRGDIRGGIQQKREECLMKVVKDQQSQSSYYVSPSDIDHDAAYALELDDVLIAQSHKGYAVKHDLYVDWALDYLVEQDCSTADACLKLLANNPVSITYLNAFGRWLGTVVDKGDVRIKAIMDAFAGGRTNSKWGHCIMTVTGCSKTYAAIFFSQFDAALKADNYALFDQFVDVLDVSCNKVSQYFEYKGERYPIYNPVGRGWDEAVLFADRNKEDYYFNHLGVLLKLLSGYSRMGKKAVAMQEAAQLSLRLFDNMAEQRKKKEYVWMQNEKPWCELVCNYAYGIKDELKAIFKQVIDNRWVKHTDPYAELIAYILKDSNNLGKTMLFLSCLDSVIELMRLFWHEQPEDPDDPWAHRSSLERDHVFGLNEEYGLEMAYFPASPYQTPVWSLLSAEQLLNPKGTKVLDFIIELVNECVETFSKRDTLEKCATITITLPDGGKHDIIASQSLWNLYRGTPTYSFPHLLESIHMALEAQLLNDADNKSKTPDWENIKQTLWRILTLSHSASLYSIVASLAVAYPEELYDILLFLCQDIRFLYLDLNRYSHELTASTLMITYHRHEQWAEERNYSNGLPHRQQHLETVLRDCQIEYDQSGDSSMKPRLEAAYKVVDALKQQAEQLKEEDSTYAFIIKRVDYRSYSKQNVTLKDGREGVLLTPTFTDEMIEEQKQLQAFSDSLNAMNLRVWVDKKFKGDDKAFANSPFNDPKHVLKTIRDIEKQFEEREDDFFAMPGDGCVPYSASAILLMHYCESLNESEKKECVERVLTALFSPDAMASDALSEFNVCIAAIPALLEVAPEKQEDIISIIATYVGIEEEYINNRICDIMSATIVVGGLWEKHREVMDAVFEKVDKGNDDALLCLLTYNPPDDKRAVGNACVKSLSQLWKNKDEIQGYKEKYHIAENVAKYILFAPQAEVPGLIAPYASLLNLEEYSEPLIEAFLLNAPQYNKYDSFWLAWNSFFETVSQQTRHHFRDDVLNTYLFNPNFLMRDYDDWFRLEVKDVFFFKRVAEEMGSDPTVLFALSRVFGTIGKHLSQQAIEVFYKIVLICNPLMKDGKKHVLYYLEKIVKKVKTENADLIERNRQFKNMFTAVLNYMVKNGSTVASEMVKVL